jgi:hypothetical protein
MGRNKRQARLAFNPLPTSSPTNSTAIKENGQRSYANVGYEGSQRQSKRRRVANEDVGDNEGEHELHEIPPEQEGRSLSVRHDLLVLPKEISEAANGSGLLPDSPCLAPRSEIANFGLLTQQLQIAAI